MTTRPRLVPLAPYRGSEASLDASPFWLGAGETCGLRLRLPAIAERHAAVIEREDGFWLVPVSAVRPAPLVNGTPAESELRLQPGDVIEILPGIAFRFTTGDRPAETPPRRAPHRKRRIRLRRAREHLGRLLGGGTGFLGPAGWAATVLALLLGAGSVVMLIRAIPADLATRPFSEDEAELLDALTLRAYEHVERGTSLLELGLADLALHEFARAVNTLQASRLREHKAVRRSVATLEGTVAAIYRSRRIAIPGRYAAARPPGGPAATMRGAISPAEFAARFARVQQRFTKQFGRPIMVTGRDHAEHLSLYGPASALDLRVRDLSREQVSFAVAALRAEGIRVKDFSDDAVLRAQIRSAHAAGLSGRAGTGLHLHADRFPDRRDRWTVQ